LNTHYNEKVLKLDFTSVFFFHKIIWFFPLRLHIQYAPNDHSGNYTDDSEIEVFKVVLINSLIEGT